jgi:DNA repair exonuclease SbcCD ATPase subunit
VRTIDEYMATLTEEERILFAPVIQECKDREKKIIEASKSRDKLLKELDDLEVSGRKAIMDLQNLKETLDNTYEKLQMIYLSQKKVGGTC